MCACCDSKLQISCLSLIYMYLYPVNQFKFSNEILLWAGFTIIINQNLRQNCTKIIIAISFV